MLFNSPTYLVFFLLVLAVYWALPWHRGRLGWLLLASLVFYAAWYPIYLLLFVGVTVFNYGAARAVDHLRTSRPVWSRRAVAIIVTLDLANLGLFKYYGFFVDSGAALGRALFGADWVAPAVSLFLPLGISFYTFQLIAYVVDVSRGDCPAIRSPLKMLLFIAFFPQLIAGPIVRANQFIGQLASRRRFDADRFLHGLDLVAVGVFKKVLVADQVASFVDRVFSAPDGLGGATLLLAIYAYSAQIYCDFSGYTDIGRGCAYMLGYELPRNFEQPYLSVNVVAFWRRWHMTLSYWLRDYLYIPLGGSRKGRGRTYVNLIVTMGLGGLWHGASWTFVVWGLLHGAALAATRLVHEWAEVAPEAPLRPGLAYRILSTAITFHFVALAWVFFRAPTFDTAFTVLAGLVTPPVFARGAIGVFGIATLGVMAAALFSFAWLHGLGTAAVKAGGHRTPAWAAARPFFYSSIVVLVTLFANRGPQQFIYFQF